MIHHISQNSTVNGGYVIHSAKAKSTPVAALFVLATILIGAAPSFAGNTAPYKPIGTLSTVNPERKDSPYELWLRPSTYVVGKTVRTRAGGRFFNIDSIQDAQRVALESQKEQEKQ